MTEQQEMTREILAIIVNNYPVEQEASWTLHPDKFREWVIETHKVVADAVKTEWPRTPARATTSSKRTR
jgi:hypothetical protein